MTDLDLQNLLMERSFFARGAVVKLVRIAEIDGQIESANLTQAQKDFARRTREPQDEAVLGALIPDNMLKL